MRLSIVILAASILIVLTATSASSLVSVEHADDTGGATVAVGDMFNVDIVVNYDGSPSLAGLFTSVVWDPSELSLAGFTDAPVSIFTGPLGSLDRLSNPFSFSIDPVGSLRTVQFGVPPGGALANAGPTTLITTLTFLVISRGDGIGQVDSVLLSGDIIFDGAFQQLDAGDFSLGGSATLIPEPATGVLLGLGLAGLGLMNPHKSQKKSLFVSSESSLEATASSRSEGVNKSSPFEIRSTNSSRSRVSVSQ